MKAIVFIQRSRSCSKNSSYHKHLRYKSKSRHFYGSGQKSGGRKYMRSYSRRKICSVADILGCIGLRYED